MADRVIGKVRRRRLNMRIGATAFLMCMLGAGMWFSNGLTSHSAKKREVASELATNQQQIAAQEALISRLIVAEKENKYQERLSALQFQPTAEDLAEQTAATMVFQADRLRGLGGSSGSALKAYDDVIQYFPRTVSFDLARKRVAEIRQEG